MDIDNQSFEDPAVLAAEKFSADGQINISEKISPEVAKQQAAFAKKIEQAKNGTLTYLDSILDAVVPAAQAGENWADEEQKITDKLDQQIKETSKEFERAKKKAKKSREKANKSRKKAKDYFRSLYAQGYTREDIIESQAKLDLRKGRDKLKRDKNMAVLIEMLDEIAEEDRKK